MKNAQSFSPEEQAEVQCLFKQLLRLIAQKKLAQKLSEIKQKLKGGESATDIHASVSTKDD